MECSAEKLAKRFGEGLDEAARLSLLRALTKKTGGDPNFFEKVLLSEKEAEAVSFMAKGGRHGEAAEFLAAPRWRPGSREDLWERKRPSTREGLLEMTMDGNAEGVKGKVNAATGLMASAGAVKWVGSSLSAKLGTWGAGKALAAGAGATLAGGMWLAGLGLLAYKAPLWLGKRAALTSVLPWAHAPAIEAAAQRLSGDEAAEWKKAGVSLQKLEAWVNALDEKKARLLSLASENDVLKIMLTRESGEEEENLWEDLKEREGWKSRASWWLTDFLGECALNASSAGAKMERFAMKAMRMAETMTSPGKVCARDDEVKAPKDLLEEMRERKSEKDVNEEKKATFAVKNKAKP